MRIACPACSASYEMDARLIPPGGTSVQCTRCNHIFTADPAPTPPAPASIPVLTPTPEPTNEGFAQAAGTGADASGRTTLLFGRAAARAARTQSAELSLPEPAQVPEPLSFGASEAAAVPSEFAPRGRPGFVPLPFSPEAGASPPSREAVRIPLAAIVAVVGAVLLGAGGWAFLHFRHGRGEVSAAARARASTAFGLLRLDDGPSRKKAGELLAALVAAHPEFVRARADSALISALALDDLGAPAAWMADEAKVARDEVAHLSLRKATADWQVRVNDLVDREHALEHGIAEIHHRSGLARGKLDEALRALPKAGRTRSEANLAVIRARGMAAAVLGQPQALELSERYRSLKGKGPWAEVIRAEYALRVGVPDTQSRSLNAMLALEKTDATFLRAYALAARLAHALHRQDVAGGQLETLSALDPDHALARRLADTLAHSRTPTP